MAIALINNGSEIRVVTPTISTNMIDHLPAKVYTIKIEPMTGALSLVIDRDKFELPKKFYGNLEFNRDIIWKTYREKKSSTGALMFGERGMGKTILAEALCNKALAMDIPVIFIRNDYPADLLYYLAKNLSPVVFLFDEFEKIYSEDESQNKLLTLFSDVDDTKNLFLVVGNDKTLINNNYFNRPGRFDFFINHSDINLNVAFDIIEDNIKDPTIEKFLKCYVILEGYVNYDTLLSIIEVSKRSNSVEEFFSHISIMNINNIPLVTIEYENIMIKEGSTITKYDNIKIIRDKKTNMCAVTIYSDINSENVSTELMTLNVSESDVRNFIIEEIIKEVDNEFRDRRALRLNLEMMLTDNIKILLKCSTSEYNRLHSISLYKNNIFNFLVFSKLSSFDQKHQIKDMAKPASEFAVKISKSNNNGSSGKYDNVPSVTVDLSRPSPTITRGRNKG